MTESTEIVVPAEKCPNCSAPLHGKYCSKCGQLQVRTDRLLATLISEAFEGVFSFNSRAWRTTFALFFKPGFLTTEYSAERRRRYIQPLRLYLITSLVFFLVLSITNFLAPEPAVVIESPNQAEQEDTDASSEGLETEITETNNATPPPEITDTVNSESSKQNKTDSQAVSDDEININILDFDIPFVSPKDPKKIEAVLERQVRKAVDIGKQHPRELLAQAIDIAPPIAFFLLPVFSLIIMLFYALQPKYYAEHLVLAVHNHSFAFASLTLIIITPPLPSIILFIWMPIYMYLGLLRVYRQSKFVTMVKFLLLLLSYLFLLGLGLLCVTLIGLMVL
ncbi:MAG: hypothetical protein ACI9FR_001617 [Cryomorphaceae bacterium]|jgi:hypothetical protein